MHVSAFAAFAALGLIPAIQAVPVIDGLAAARFLAAGSRSLSLATATVVTETFTIPLGPSSTVIPGSASVPTAAPTLSSVLATFTIPYGNTSTTLLHTFTYTPDPSSSASSASASPFPTSASAAPILSIEPASVSSLDSIFRSLMSGLDTGPFGTQSPHTLPVAQSSQDGPKPVITARFTLTLPTGKPTPETSFFVPTHTGPMTTASFTLTLPAATDSTTAPSLSSSTCTTSTTTSSSTCESTITTPTPTCETTSTTSTCETTSTSTSSCETTSTSTSTCETTSTSTSTCEKITTSSKPTTHTWPETRTYTLSTKVTIVLSPTAPSATGASSGSPVPSGTAAITLTYTLPAGPDRTSQVVTITTVRPAGPAGTGVGTTVSGRPSSGTHISSVSGLPSSVIHSSTVSGRPIGAHSSSISGRPSSSTHGSSFSGRPSSVTHRSSVFGRPSSVTRRSSVSGFPSSAIFNRTMSAPTAGVPATGTGRPRSSLSWSFSGNSSSYSSTGSGTGLGTGTAVSSIAPTGLVPNLPFQSSTSGTAVVPAATATATATATQVVIVTKTRTHGQTPANLAARFTPPVSRPLEETTVFFTAVRADPTPAVDSIRETTKDREAPGCSASHLTMNFDYTKSLFNDPSHEMRFGDGFSRIVGEKGDPFTPSSKPALLEFVPNRYGGATAGTIQPVSGCMRFSLSSFMIGCSTMYSECRVTVTGVRTASGVDETVASKTFTIPQTTRLVNNKLQPISMDSTNFTNLTSVVVSIEVPGSPPFPSWYMDDLDVDLLCNEPTCLQTRNTPRDIPMPGAVPFWHRKHN